MTDTQLFKKKAFSSVCQMDLQQTISAREMASVRSVKGSNQPGRWQWQQQQHK